ncbi:MAG: hypothetical protein R3264_22595 [Anaerolineae bacterium]|nr:hypothetical protein [Anaerolineae bacterium]
MPSKNHVPAWMLTNAWREILFRIFAETTVEHNVTPAWLVNPATNRRLKLDLLYPELGVAVRFEGLQGKNRRARPGLEEEVQQRTRDNARVEICRQHGVALIVVDSNGDDPKAIFQEIDAQLSRANQRLTDPSPRQIISDARTTAARISRQIKSNQDLRLYADLWQDRQYQAPAAAPPDTPPAPTISFAEGMEVEHTLFGPGVVTGVAPADSDVLVTVDFVTAGQKTLAASLVGDKLIPR